MERIAVLGLDALPYWSVRGLVESGVTPFLFDSRTIDAVRGLRAVPPVTPASWPSIMGGVNPGKHGIFSFFHVDKRDFLRFHYTSLRDLMHPRVHEILHYNGLRSIMVNPIPDHPILPLKNSIIVSNLFFTPRPASSPRWVHEKYFSHLSLPPKPTADSYIEYLQALKGMLEDLLADPPSLTWVTLNFPDLFFHHDISLAKAPWREGRVWREIDSLARLLYEAAGELVVVSDHGYRVYERRVNINDILYKAGLAVPASRGEPIPKYAYSLHGGEEESKTIRVPPWLSSLLRRLHLMPLARAAYLRIVKPLYARLTGKPLEAHAGYMPSYTRSRALMPHEILYGVYARDEEAVVEALSALRGAEGLSLVERAERVYSGPYVGRGPDIVVLQDDERGYNLGSYRIYGAAVSSEASHHHDLTGILAWKGEVGGEMLSRLPERVPNHVVAGLVLCALRVPLSGEQDDRGLVEGACPYSVSYRNYVGRFLAAKKLLLRKMGGG